VNAFFPAGVLAIDAVVVVAAAWLVVRWLGPGLPGVLEPLLAWLWAAGAVVAGSGVLLGAAGWLGAAGFITVHAALLALLAALRRAELAGDAARLREVVRHVAGAGSRRLPEGPAMLFLGGFLVLMAGLAAFAHPVVYDALTYRLPRIAQWLQDGRIAHYPSSDPRQNYMPVAPDLVMAWLLGGARDGFRPAALAQWYGGALVMLATYGIARRTCVSPLGSLGAVVLLFGMANVVPQFSSVHTDLFAAGELAAAFCLWTHAANRGEGSVLAGLAAGLALGSKGTLFYLIPGAAVWLAWTAYLYRPPLKAWAATLLAAALSCAVFCGPVFARNLSAYGSILGPADSVRLVLGGGLSDTRLSKLATNLESSFAQVFDPNSQPPGLRAGSRRIGLALAARLPENDPFAYEGINRRKALEALFLRTDPDADATTFGVGALLGLVAAAATAASSPRRPGAGSVLAWSLGIAAFWTCFNQVQLWNPYGFRYSVLVAPWMAVAAAWWMQTLPRMARGTAWAVSFAAALGVSSEIIVSTHQAGWRAIAEPGHSRGFFVFSQWRDWLGGLDSGSGPLRPALGYNEPVAAFYRLPVSREVRPEPEPDPSVRTAEELMRGRSGWIVVPAALFMGREGNVDGRTWLFGGDPTSTFSLAAYRALAPGESPGPLVYRRESAGEPRGTVCEMLVRSWSDVPIRLSVRNGGHEPCRYTLISSIGSETGELAGPGATEVLVPMPKGAVGEVTARFDPLRAGGAPPTGTSIDLAPY
jgi:hypothetical protein